MAAGNADWRSAQQNWYWGEDDIDRAFEELEEYPSVEVHDETAARVLLDRIGYSLNGIFLSLQDAIGQKDGGIASVFASGWETVAAGMIAADVCSAGARGKEAWDGRTFPPEWDGTPVVDLGKVAKASEITADDVRTVTNAYLLRLADDLGIGASSFGNRTRVDLLDGLIEYLSLEAAYERDEEKNAVPSP